MTRVSYRIASLLALLAFFLLTAPQPAFAQEATDAATAESAEAAEAVQEVEHLPFGIGFQSSWPAWGISGLYDINERITAQAVIGAFGTLSTFGARGLYRFSQEDAYNVYGYGSVGMWRYPGLIRENVVGVGGGAGIELNWRRILSAETGSFPPLFSSIDLGLILANFEHYNFSGFTVGSGLHYRF